MEAPHSKLNYEETKKAVGLDGDLMEPDGSYETGNFNLSSHQREFYSLANYRAKFQTSHARCWTLCILSGPRSALKYIFKEFESLIGNISSIKHNRGQKCLKQTKSCQFFQTLEIRCVF